MQYQSSPFPIRKPLVVAIQNVFLGITACCTVLYPVGMAYAGTSETSAAFTATQVVRQFTLRNTVVQANEALQSQVADVSGTLKGAAMGSYGVLAADMGTVPSGIGVPQRDGAGRALGYCAWDNTNASSNSSYLGGSGASVPLVYAVVSAGLNGAIETSCAYILANRTALGDDYVQVRLPAKVSATTFKTAVNTQSALPAGTEGDIRLVLDTNTLYSYTGSAWAPVKSTGSFTEDGSGNLSYALGKVTVATFEASTATFSGNVSVGGETTLTGALTANNGITVSSGGASITGNTSITGTLTVGSNTTVTGTVTATGFSGNGSSLSNLNANNISSGTLGVARGGTGVDASATANGQLLIGNGTGFTLGNLIGTANQVLVGNSSGGIALSLPQNIATASTPTFGGMTLNGVLTGTTATLSGNVTAKRLLLGDSTGGVLVPNIVIGSGALGGTPSGDGDNIAIGLNVLAANTSGADNIGLGEAALFYNTTGGVNAAVGYGALYSNLSGEANAAFGTQSLYSNVTGEANAAFGVQALRNSTGSNNTALGVWALGDLNSGSGNTALGRDAGKGGVGVALTSGSNNTFLGAYSGLDAVSSVSYATVIGSDATVSTSNTVVLGRTTDSTVIGATGTASSGMLSGKKLQVTGDVGVNGTLYATGLNISGSTSFNSLALTGALTGTTATFSGAVSGSSFSGNGSALSNLNASNISSGTLGVARGGTGVNASAAANGQLLIGNGTGFTLGNLIGTANQVLVGNSAGGIALSLPQDIATASTPTFGGMTLNGVLTGTTATLSGNVTAKRLLLGDSTGGVTTANIVIGNGAMNASPSGAGANTAVGVRTLMSNTSGQNNVALGTDTLLSNTTGSRNTALGAYSMWNNTTGRENTAVGEGSLFSTTTGSFNTVVGSGALFLNLTGYENTGLGRAALVNSTGSGNSAAGNLALSQIVSGDDNTALGNFTGTRDSTRYLTSGSYNTLLGAWSGPSAGVNSLSYATAIGAYAEVSTDSTVVLGRTTDTTVIGATGTASSGMLSGKKLQVTGDVGVNGTLYATGLNISGSTSFNSLALTGALTGTTATFSGAVTAASFSGSGTGLTGLNASNFSSGTLGVARGGTGVNASAAANGQLLIGNGTGFTLANLTGTANQVVVGNSSGGITLSLPQNIATASTPTFGGMTLNGVLTGTTATLSGTLSAQRVSVADSTGVSNANLIIGPEAMAAVQTGTGANTALGKLAMNSNTSGANNTAVGRTALVYNINGWYNVAVGGNALAGNTSGSENASLGYRALDANTTGSNNVAIGSWANVGGVSLNYATAIGSYAEVGTSNTVVLGRTTDTTVIGATGTASSGLLSGKILQVTGNVGVVGTGTSSGGWTTSSDRRLKTDFSQMGDDILSKLSALNAYQYRYIADPTRAQRYGVIAQEVAALFPNAVMSDGGGYLAVDYGALGAIAAAGVGKLNKQFIALNNTVTEQGKQLSTLETKVNSMDERVLALEGWRVTATTRMDSMQKAIDLNIEKIAEHALKIAANEEKLTKLETVVGKIDERVVGTESRLDKVEGRWSSTFSVSEDGQVLTVQASHLVASNFTAQQLKAKVAYTERLEAEMARIRELEVNNLKANTASAETLQAGSVQAATVNTGSLQVFVSAGLPAFLFSAPEDGHYTVNTSASDGSYASASVIVNMGQVKVVTFKSEGIELIGDGNAVKVLSNGKMIRASWTKTG